MLTQLPQLLHYVHGRRLLADKGFSSEANREAVRKMGIKSGLSFKASRHRPLSFSQRLFNKIVARRRFRIKPSFWNVEAEISNGTR